MEAEVLDLRGMACPLPVLSTKKALAKKAAGDVVEVLTDDPHAVPDIRLFCEQSGHILVAQEMQADGKTTKHVVKHRP